MRSARRVLGDTHDAEDAVQGAFDDALAALLRGQLVSVAYVATALRHRCLSLRRPERVQCVAPTELDMLPSTASMFDHPVNDPDASGEVTWWLAHLPRKTRAVVWLWATGLTHDDIARALGIAVSTVRTHLRRGLKKLREVAAQG